MSLSRSLLKRLAPALLIVLSGCYDQTEAPPPSRPTAALEAFREAESALREGQLNIALHHAEAAVAADPTFDEAAWLQASLLGRAGRLEEALAVCNALTDRSPDFVQAHLLQGILWDQSGNLEAAHQSYDRVLERYDTLRKASDLGARDALLDALVTFLRHGELEGVKAVNQYLARFPEHPAALYLKGCMQQKERGFLLRWFSESSGGETPARADEAPHAGDPGPEAPAGARESAPIAEKE